MSATTLLLVAFPTRSPALAPISEFCADTFPVTPALALPQVTAPALARPPLSHKKLVAT